MEMSIAWERGLISGSLVVARLTAKEMHQNAAAKFIN